MLIIKDCDDKAHYIDIYHKSLILYLMLKQNVAVIEMTVTKTHTIAFFCNKFLSLNNSRIQYRKKTIFTQSQFFFIPD